MQELCIFTTNEEWQPQFIDRTDLENRFRPLNKHLKLKSFFFYWEAREKQILSRIGTFKEIETQLKYIGKAIPSKNFILKPLNLEVKFVQSGNSNDFSKPRYTAKVQIAILKFTIRKPQFDNIIGISKVLDRYQRMQRNFENTCKYKLFRPICPLLMPCKTPTLKQKFKNENTVLWWKYAIECVRRKIRETKGMQAQFRISDREMKSYKREFFSHFIKIVEGKSLDEMEQLRYKKILSIFDIKQLKLWAGKILQKLEQHIFDKRLKEKSKESEGWLSYFFGSGPESPKKEEGIDTVLSLLESHMGKEGEEELADPNLFPEDQVRTDEYYWLVGEFFLTQGAIKIQRDSDKNSGTMFKEAIVIKVTNVHSGFFKRYKGMDLEAGIGDVVLSTYSTLGKQGKNENQILRRNTLSEGLPKSDLGSIKINFLPPHSAYQVEIEAYAKSLRIFYLPLLIARILMFVGQEQARSDTLHALNEIKDTTQEQIQAVMKNKKPRISITIESPILIIPIFQNNDPNSPIWFLRLGDISINSATSPKKDELPYDHFALSLSNIRLDCYRSLLAFEEYENTRSSKKEDLLCVIKEFSINLFLGIFRGQKRKENIPASIADCEVSAIEFFFTPQIYNYFNNISSALDVNDEDEAWDEVFRDKASILKAQRMMGIVKKRGTYMHWNKFYCCLSGGHMYFYETNKQKYPTSYFSLRDAEILDGMAELGIANTLVLKNKLEYCCIALGNPGECLKWKKIITEVVKEISLLSEAFYQPKKKAFNWLDIENQSTLKIGKLSINFLDENLKDLVRAEAYRGEILFTKFPKDVQMECTVGDAVCFHPTNIHFQKILYSQECSGSILKFSIQLLNPLSPKFTNSLILVDVLLSDLVVHYPPKLIKKMMQILTNTLRKFKPDVEAPEKKGEVLSEEEKDIITQVDTCKTNPQALFFVTVKTGRLELNCLHSKYDTPLFRLFTESLDCLYLSYVDHDNITVHFGKMNLEDLTNYPNTLCPFFDEGQAVVPQSLATLGPSAKRETPLFLELKLYQLYCPKQSHTPVSSEMDIEIGKLTVHYYNEIVAFRFMDYLIFQFFESMTPRDTYAEKLTLYELHKKSYEGQDIYPIPFFDLLSAMRVVIDEPIIILKPRFHFKDYFKINLGTLRFWNERRMSRGRWVHHPEETLLCETYVLDTPNCSIMFNDKIVIMEETHFLLESEMLCVQAHDTNNHSAGVLDQSIHLLVRSRSPIVKLSLTKDCYTYLLKCLDLNINYTDNFEEHFNFRQVSLPPISGGIKFVSDCYLSVFSFELLNADRSIISELVILDFDMKWVNYNDNSKDIFVGASSLFALHNESSPVDREKDVLIGPLNSEDTVESDYSFYKQSDFRACSIDIKITPQYEKHWKVKILRHKSVVKIYVLMLLSDFLIEGFPDYSKEIEKPNEYIEDPEKYPQSSYILDLKETELILPSEESEFRILLQGDLNLVLRMKSIAQIKEQLFEANPRELKLESYFFGVALQDMQVLVRNTSPSSKDSNRSRILIRKFNLNFKTSEAMLIHNELCKVEGDTLLGLDPVFITLSYQDILSITRSCIYNISRIDADYFKKEKFQKNVQDLNVSQIMEENKEVSQLMEENKDEFFPELDKKVSDDFNFLKLPLERGKSEYFSPSPKASNRKENPNLFDTVNIFMEEFARMKERASKRLAQFQQHVTKYLQSSRRDLIASQTLRRSSEFSEESRVKALFNLSESFVRKESMKSSGRPSISSQHSVPSYTDSLEISKEKYERLNDTFQIDCQSIKLLFINDINNVFYPVISLNLLNPQYFKTTKRTEISVKLQSLYYNPSSSFWEPLFEKIIIEAKQVSGENVMNISINKPIQFNFTEALVNVVLTTYKSWRENTTMFNESSDLFSRECMQQYVRRSRAASGSAEGVLEQGVCPYYIKNDTGMDIYYKESRAGSEKIRIRQNEILDILEHYEEVIENLVKEASHSLKFSEKIIEISFADPNFAPINRLTLSTAHPVIHRLNSLPFRHLIYSINMANISKQITLRTPFKIKNRTKYAFTLLFKDSTDSLFEFTINSRECLNIPVSLIESEMQLCWKSDSSQGWRVPALLKYFRKKEYLDAVVGEINVVMAREGKPSSWMVDIVLIPPFVFMNILPYPIEIKTLESEAQNILLTGEEMKFYRISSLEVLTFELKVPRFSPCEVRFDPSSPLKLQKVEFSGLTLYIGLVRNESARHCYSIYARSIIINNADPNLKYYEANKLIAGQPARCVMISKFKSIRIGFDEETRSNQILFNDPTSVLDVKIIRQKETKEGRREEYDYRILNSLSLANRDKHVYTRVFTIVPRYVIHNLTPCSLRLAQEDALNSLCSVLAEPQTPTQFHWRSPMRSGRISILYLEKKNTEEDLFLPEAENANQWDWSSSFGLNEEEVLDVPCLHRTKSHSKLHLNVRKVIVEGTMIIEIRLQSEATPVYQIVNQSKYFSILFWQEKKELVTNYLKPLSSASYGFADIHSDPILCVKFFLTNNENPVPLCLDHAVHQFDLDRMNQEIKLYFRYTRKVGYCLFVSTENNGRTKTLKIQASTKFSDSDPGGSNAAQKYSLDIKELGISLVHTHENQRSELAYISLQGLKAEMESRSKFTDIKLSIENMQIDNMFSLRVPYPIILQSTELKKTPKPQNS